MLTLESAVAGTLAILLVFAAVALAPPLYLMSQQAARLEVLAVLEDVDGSRLYQAAPLQLQGVRVTGLQTSPQKVLELVALARDYRHWAERWLELSR